MTEDNTTGFACDQCGEPAGKDDTFCKNCGALFAENLVCVNHPSAPAAGVCLICSKPFCKRCGEKSQGVFLCDPHSFYETQEGMARVYGTFDNVQAQYVTSLLEQAGFHPFFYSRIFNPGPDLVALNAPRNFGNYPPGEMKVLVPYGEVLKAEEMLRELGFIKAEE